MAAADLKLAAVRALPFVVLAVLVAWTAWEVVQIDFDRWDATLQGLLVVAVAGLLASRSSWGRWPRRLGILLLGSTYFAVRMFALGFEIVSALSFLTLVIVYVELQMLSERFAPAYARIQAADERRRIDEALGRSLLRLSAASFLAVLVPILAADLALSGVFPATTIPTVFFLGASLIAVVAILALLPSFGRGRAVVVSGSTAPSPPVDVRDRPRASRGLPSSRRWPGGALVRGRRF